MPAATATFRESTSVLIGMRTRTSADAAAAALRPAPSFPRSSARRAADAAARRSDRAARRDSCGVSATIVKPHRADGRQARPATAPRANGTRRTAPIEVRIALRYKRIQVVGASRIAVDAERRRVAEDAADVVGVGDRLQHQDEPGLVRADAHASRLRRTLDERDTAAMDVEAGDLAERLRSDRHRRARADRVARAHPELLLSRLAQQHRPDAVAAGFDQTADDEAAFRDEEAQAGVPDRGRRRSHTRQFGRRRRPAA